MDTLRSIADHLEISADYLLGLTDDPYIHVREPGMNIDERDLLDVFRREGWPGVLHLGAAYIQKIVGGSGNEKPSGAPLPRE